VRLIRRSTRVYVRRQANWFRQEDENIHWFTARPGIEEEMAQVIETWIIQN